MLWMSIVVTCIVVVMMTKRMRMEGAVPMGGVTRMGNENEKDKTRMTRSPEGEGR